MTPEPARPPTLSGLRTVPDGGERVGTPAPGLSGHDLEGRPAAVQLAGAGRPTLLLFLSSSCDGCVPFWAALADPPAAGFDRLDLVAVVSGAGKGAPDRVGPMVPPGAVASVVVAPAAYRDYRVAGGPFFVLVERRAQGPVVATEGVAWSPAQVAADCARALGRA